MSFDRRTNDARLDELEKNLSEHEKREESEITYLIEMVGELKEDIAEVSEIVKAWNSAKGFVATVRFLAKALAIAALLLVPFVDLGAFIKAHLK